MTKPLTWARDLDSTGSLHICTKDDSGAIPLYGAEAIKEVVAGEREACAKVAQENAYKPAPFKCIRPQDEIAAAIRARKD